MKSVHRGFCDRLGDQRRRASSCSGLFYLHFDAGLSRHSIRRPQPGFPGARPTTSRPACRPGSTFGIAGLDMRPAWTCLIGIILAVA